MPPCRAGLFTSPNVSKRFGSVRRHCPAFSLKTSHGSPVTSQFPDDQSSGITLAPPRRHAYRFNGSALGRAVGNFDDLRQNVKIGIPSIPIWTNHKKLNEVTKLLTTVRQNKDEMTKAEVEDSKSRARVSCSRKPT